MRFRQTSYLSSIQLDGEDFLRGNSVLSSSSQMQSFLRILVNDIGDANCWNDLQEIRCNALEKPSHALVLDGSLRHVDNASIRRGV